MPPAAAIRTARLSLDPLRLGDAAAIARLHADPRVSRYLLDGVPRTLREATIYIGWALSLAPPACVYAARRPGEIDPIGLFSLVPFGEGGPLELGGKLAPAGWRGNLAFEAGTALIDHVFADLGHEELVSAHHSDNRSVPALLARLGFADAGETIVFGSPARLMRMTRAGWIGLCNRND